MPPAAWKEVSEKPYKGVVVNLDTCVWLDAKGHYCRCIGVLNTAVIYSDIFQCSFDLPYCSQLLRSVSHGG